MNYREPIILEPSVEARSAIIWLHGLGADGNDFVPVVPALNVQDQLGLRFVFPHASIRPVSVNNGYQMPAWYDVYSTEIAQKIDHAGIAQSVTYLNQLIENQVNSGIPLNRLVLAGFSQGGVIALDCALRMQEKPAGVMALSTYLADTAAGSGEGLHVFHAHGLHDHSIPIQIAHVTEQALKQLGTQVESHQYAIAHSVHPQEIADIAAWLVDKLTV